MVVITLMIIGTNSRSCMRYRYLLEIIIGLKERMSSPLLSLALTEVG